MSAPLNEHYRTLGIQPGASRVEIKRAYRRLAREVHPDRHPDDREAKDLVQLKARAFVRRFAELNGALRCRDLIDMDIDSEEAVEEYYARNMKVERCNAIVSNAVRAVLELSTPASKM